MNLKLKANISDNKNLSYLVHGSIVSFGLSITGIGIGYVFILIISRTGGAGTIGIFTLAMSVIQIAAIAGRLGLDRALLRFVAEYAAQNRMDIASKIYVNAVTLALFAASLISVCLFFLSEIIAVKCFNNPELTKIFRISTAGIVPLTLTFLNFETLRALKKIKKYAFLQNISTFLLSAVALLILFRTQLTAEDVVTVFVCAIFITWVLSQFWVTSFFRKSIFTRRDSFFSILKISFPMMVSGSLMLLMDWTDILMIGMFLDETSVGIYSIAFKVATMTSIALMAINSIAAPRFAELYSQGDMVSLQQTVTYASRLMFYISLPVLIVSILFHEPILRTFGQGFEHAGCALVILCIGQFINVFSGSVGYLLQMTGFEKVFQYVIIGSIILNIALNYFLIPIYGINGAAVANAVSLATWNLSSAYIILKKLKIVTVFSPNILSGKFIPSSENITDT